MTLDEAIEHAEEATDEKMEEACNLYDAKNYEESRECIWCAEEHRQLAKWLKDYKRLLEQTDVSNTNVVDLISREEAKSKAVYSQERHEKVVPVAELDWLPSVEPERKTGKWLSTIRHCRRWMVCSQCRAEHMYDHSEGWNYCPNCGAKMDDLSNEST